jgi:hypothetical protein
MNTPRQNKIRNPKAKENLAPLATDDLPEWSNLEEKKKIFQDIIGEILLKPELGQLYVKDSCEARKAFERRIKVPPEIKIIFLPAGDTNIPNGGSAIIELPRVEQSIMSPNEKLELFVCTYNPW